MVSLIIGKKGTGKTKHLISEVNSAIENSKGHVICVEKSQKLTYDIDSRVRLVSADDFKISGYENYYGFLAGMCASDHDVTDILADGTLKIIGDDKSRMADFFKKVKELGDAVDTRFIFTVSADKSELPEEIFKYCEVI